MIMKPLLDEKTLLQRVANGDQHAFKILYEQYNRKLLTHCIRLLHSKELAEEVMHEIFLKLWRMGDALNGINNLEAYLKTTSRNRCLNAIRKMIKEEKADQLLTENHIELHNETEEAIILNDTKNLIRKAVDQLPMQQREVYILCHEEGLKYAEVAERLNISVNTVQTHMSRALKFLRSRLQNNVDLTAILIVLKIL